MYEWEQLSEIDMYPADDSYGDSIEIYLSELGKIDNMAHDDESLRCLWEVDTPLGENTHQKSDVIRYLHWLLFFRTFQRGTHRAIDNGIFKQAIDFQDPWYFIVGEHDQMRSLIAEYSITRGLKPPTRFRTYPKKSAYDNIERLVVNSQIEKPCDTYLEWVASISDFDSYTREIEQIPFSTLENNIEQMLQEEFTRARDKKYKFGGIYLEWMNTDEYRSCMGYPFYYDQALK